VTLIQVGVPSRTEVPEYKALANQVNELVGRINGNYGTLEYSPVHYINQVSASMHIPYISNAMVLMMLSALYSAIGLQIY
jgi:trehalose-6-phosphate synthase